MPLSRLLRSTARPAGSRPGRAPRPAGGAGAGHDRRHPRHDHRFGRRRSTRRGHGDAPERRDQRRAHPHHERKRRVRGHAAPGRHLRRERPGARVHGSEEVQPDPPAGRDAGRPIRARAAGGAAAGAHRGGGAVDRRDLVGERHPARRRSGGGTAQQRPQHLQLHDPHAQRGHRAGPRRRRDQHRRPAGIHNNVSVDGADFNNPFFGEQRGGQRPAFTFNLDAVQDFVVVADGANAEFGRSSGGFVNVITKSGTNEFHGSAHYFGKYDALSADYSHTFPGGGTTGFAPDFTQHQFGATFGGPLVRDKAFFFLAYDQQEYNDTKQTDRLATIDPALVAFTDTAFGGVARGRLRADRADQRRQRAAGQARLPARARSTTRRSSTTTPAPASRTAPSTSTPGAGAPTRSSRTTRMRSTAA